MGSPWGHSPLPQQREPFRKARDQTLGEGGSGYWLAHFEVYPLATAQVSWRKGRSWRDSGPMGLTGPLDGHARTVYDIVEQLDIVSVRNPPQCLAAPELDPHYAHGRRLGRAEQGPRPIAPMLRPVIHVSTTGQGFWDVCGVFFETFPAGFGLGKVNAPFDVGIEHQPDTDHRGHVKGPTVAHKRQRDARNGHDPNRDGHVEEDVKC
jgi:hypothetical protein